MTVGDGSTGYWRQGNALEEGGGVRLGSGISGIAVALRVLGSHLPAFRAGESRDVYSTRKYDFYYQGLFLC